MTTKAVITSSLIKATTVKKMTTSNLIKAILMTMASHGLVPVSIMDSGLEQKRHFMAGAATTFFTIITTTMIAITIIVTTLAQIREGGQHAPNQKVVTKQIFTSIITTIEVAEIGAEGAEVAAVEVGADNEKIPSPYFCQYDHGLRQSFCTNHRNSLSF